MNFGGGGWKCYEKNMDLGDENVIILENEI